MSLKTIFPAKFFVLGLIPYLIPFASLIWFVANFGVNVPFGDDWALVPLFQNIALGKVTFQDFFAQHNEHRILFPRLIVSALAFISRWNIQLELYFNIALAAITFLSLIKIASDQTQHRNQIFHIANIATCFIIFSLVQWENWSWGFQIAWFLVDACLVISILAFSSGLCKTLQVKFVIAASACFIASFSSAHGLLTWIAVVPALVAGCKDVRQFRKFGLLWVVLFLTALLLYLIDYHKPSHHPDLWFFLKEPRLAATYFLSLLGSPLLYHSGFSSILGFAAFSNFIFFVARSFKAARSSKEARSRFSDAAAPWLSLGSFSILFALMTTIGRAGFGVEQAYSSRYTTVSILLLIALVQLWRLTSKQFDLEIDKSVVEASNASSRQGISSNTFLISLSTFLVLVASINSLPSAENHRSHLQYGQVCLEVADYIASSPDNCLQILFPKANALNTWANVLDQIGFRQFPGKTVGFVTEPDKVYGYLDTPATSKNPAIVRTSCLNCKTFNVDGWAILPKQGKPAQLVFLSHDQNPETFFANTYVSLSSPDVAKALSNDHYDRARWNITVSPKLLPLGKIVLNAWVYDPDDKKFVKLRGEPTLSVEE